MWTSLSKTPREARVVVDVSNLTRQQLADVREPAVLVSKDTSFEHQVRNAEVLPDGTTWLVLRVPYAHHKHNDQPVVSTFDRRTQQFRRRRDRSKSPRMHYVRSKPSICRITSRGKRSSKAHAFCEVDDVVIKAIATHRRIPIVTNDRQLRHSRLRVHPMMDELLRHTKVTVLRKSGSTWS